MTLSVYGATGIIGSYFSGLYKTAPVSREELAPSTKEVLYLISTTSNFYDDAWIHADTNLTCLLKRLEACRKSGVVVFNFVSSWFVYSDTDNPMKEDGECNPTDIYPITKHCAEQLVIDYCSRHGISWRILRLGNVYGNSVGGYGMLDTSNGARNVLGHVIKRLKDDKEVFIINGLTRDYIHVYDTCRAIELVCRTGKLNEIYNIGSGQSVPVIDAALLCKKIINTNANCEALPSLNPVPRLKMALDCNKIFALGFRPLISLEEGLADLCTNQKFSTPVHFLTAKKSRLQLTAFRPMAGFRLGQMWQSLKKRFPRNLGSTKA